MLMRWVILRLAISLSYYKLGRYCCIAVVGGGSDGGGDGGGGSGAVVVCAAIAIIILFHIHILDILR